MSCLLPSSCQAAKLQKQLEGERAKLASLERSPSRLQPSTQSGTQTAVGIQSGGRAGVEPGESEEGPAMEHEGLLAAIAALQQQVGMMLCGPGSHSGCKL